jgi:hypothetical protein
MTNIKYLFYFILRLKIWNLISQCLNIREMANFFGLTHEIIDTKRSIVCYISNNDINNRTITLYEK